MQRFVVRHEVCSGELIVNPPVIVDDIGTFSLTITCPGCGASLTAEVDHESSSEYMLSLARMAGFAGSDDDVWEQILADEAGFQRRIDGSPIVRSAFLESYARNRRAERRH